MKKLFALALCGLLYFGTVETAAAQAPKTETMLLTVESGFLSKDRIISVLADGTYTEETTNDIAEKNSLKIPEKQARTPIVVSFRLNGYTKDGWQITDSHTRGVSSSSISNQSLSTGYVTTYLLSRPLK